MAKEELLEKAYASISRLLASGAESLNVEQVSKISGVARSTFYLDDSDWHEVRAVIRGKASSRLSDMRMELDLSNSSSRKVMELRSKVEAIEDELNSIRTTADSIYRTLIDQLQFYFALSAETPAKKENQSQLLQSAALANQQVKLLRAENSDLRAQLGKSPGAAHSSRKLVIRMSSETPGASFYSEILDNISRLLPFDTDWNPIANIYILSGLPYSGRGLWIDHHQPSSGDSLYFLSTFHTREARTFVIDRIRKLSTKPIHCVRIRTPHLECAKTCAKTVHGVKRLDAQQSIELIFSKFEEIELTENFDSIILR